MEALNQLFLSTSKQTTKQKMSQTEGDQWHISSEETHVYVNDP